MKARLISYFALTLAGAIAAWGFASLRNVETKYSVRQFLPDQHPSYAIEDQIRALFKLSEHPAFFAVIQLEGQGTFFEPDRAKRLRAAVEKIQSSAGVRRVASIATVEKAFEVGETIMVSNIMASTPPAKWRSLILNDPLLSALITRDARTTSVMVEIGDIALDQMKSVQAGMRKILSDAFPEAKVEIGGAPAIQVDLSSLLYRELGLFLILSMVVCGLTIAMIFKNFSAIVIPFALNAISTLAVFGWMAALGIPFTVMSTTLPIMIFVTVMTIATHLMLRVHEEIRENPTDTVSQVVWRANREVFIPNFLGPLTTLLGFVTLLVTDVPLLRQYGWSVIGAVATAWAVTQIFILPLLLVMKPPQPRQWTLKKATWLFPILRYHKSMVVLCTLGCVLLAVAGLNLKWTALIFDDLPNGHEARRTTEVIDKKLGGAIPLEITIGGKRGDYWNDPERIAKLDKLLNQVRKSEAVGTAIGVPDFLKSASFGKDVLPTSRAGVAETFFLYSMSEANPLTHFLSNDGKWTRLSLRVSDMPANELKALTETVKQEASAMFPGEDVRVGGMAATVHEINNTISGELILDFWKAVFITSVTLILVFRSWRWAIVACLPNIVAPISLLGFLGLTGTPIKPVVAMIFSVVLGLAFGNTVYMINRLMGMQRKNRHGFLPAKRAFYLEGNPCMVSTLIIASGFSVFLFSDFSVNQTFGLYILISIAAGVVGDVVFLPSFLKWFPQFVKASPKAKVVPLSRTVSSSKATSRAA